MKPAKSISIVLLVTILALFIVPACLAGDNSDYVISPGDTLEISVWGQEDLRRKVEVSPQGEFTYPPLGRTQAGGLTVFELEQKLREGLAGRFLVDPRVSINVVISASRKVFILGEVRKPGAYILTGRTTLSQLLAEAGGLTDQSADTATIIRPPAVNKNSEGPITPSATRKDTIFTRDLRQLASGGEGGQFVLAPGDTIHIPESAKFYVIGEVKRPGEFKWRNGLTVRQALSMAGGPTGRAAPNRTEIVRSTTNGDEQTFRPEMNDSVAGGDVVKVPMSYF